MAERPQKCTVSIRWTEREREQYAAEWYDRLFIASLGYALRGVPYFRCVDDASNELESRKMLLEENGFRVLPASNGIEALQAFISHPVDLVLLDYHMPQMNGDVAAEQMKGCKPEVPVALLSADDCVPESKLKTVDVFVSKSESITAFLAIVDHLLSLRFLFQPLGDLGTGEGRSAA